MNTIDERQFSNATQQTIAGMEAKIKELEAERTLLIAVAKAAKEYTTERVYSCVEACKRDQDLREKLLLKALSQLPKGILE